MWSLDEYNIIISNYRSKESADRLLHCIVSIIEIKMKSSLILLLLSVLLLVWFHECTYVHTSEVL